MDRQERNIDIKILYEINGWTHEEISAKHGISLRQIRRILKTNDGGRPVDVSPIVEDTDKFSLYKDDVFVESNNDLKSFETTMVYELTDKKLNWITERLDKAGTALINGYEIRLGAQAQEAYKEATIESLEARINSLESIFRDIVAKSTDVQLVQIIQKKL